MVQLRRRRSVSSAEREIPDVEIRFDRLLAYLRPYIIRLLIALLALIGSAGLSLVFPALIGGVGSLPGLLNTVLTTGDTKMLNQITAILLVVFAVRSLTSLIETYQLNYVGERIVVDVRKNLYSRLQSMSMNFFIERRVGELVSRLSNDVTAMRTALTNNVTTLLQQGLILIGSIIIMFVINWRLSLFISALIPMITAVAFIFGYYLRRTSTLVQDQIAGATIVAEEALQNIREVKSFVREPYEIGRYNTAIDNAFRAALQLLRVRVIIGPIIAFMAFSGLALIVWFGGREVIAGRLSGGELIAFLIYGLTVTQSLVSLIGLYTSVQEALGAVKRVFQLLDTEPDLQDMPHAVELGLVSGRIAFDGVSFSYDDRQQVLNEIHLDVSPGEIIALVGPSGAGKSTIFNLIPRFYDPSAGRVLIDGIDIRQVTQSSLRQKIGIVPQETMLFGGTIRDNILYGRLDASEHEMIEAAKAANAHDFILTLPDGYETIVGERGTRLSGGQRQRVAIARAILKDPRILLLDEATSSLDNESEQLVHDALSRLMLNRTTVIIAHRLSTIRIAHRIAVLAEGRIIELGTHDDLIAQRGLYAHLYEMQFREMDIQSVREND